MDLPCIDCLCFPICKNTVPMKNSGTALMGHIQNNLITKCSLLNDYIYFNTYFGSEEHMSETMNYFRRKM